MYPYFFVDKEGAEKTSSVIEAVEDSELLTISYNEFHQLVDADIFWKEFYLKSLEFAYLRQSKKIEALMTLDANQRYQKLLKGNPSLIQKLSNKMLASFLHVREETLSRIKSK